MKTKISKKFFSLSMVIVASLAIAGCAQSPSGADYRSEIGANGLPTPRALYAINVDAIGGERVIRSNESMTMQGRFILEAFGLEGTANIYSAAPNYISQVINIPGLGEINTGYNGSVGWSVDPMQGNSLLEGDMLADMRQQSDFYLPLNLARIYIEAETEELVQVRGNDAYRVRAVNPQGKATHMYFGVESGLLVRLDTVVASPIGNVNVVTIFDGFKSFDGQTLPTDMTISQAGQEFRIVFDEISFDDVAESQFDVPPQIEPLL